MNANDQALTYETAYAELSSILQTLEEGVTSIDELAQNVTRAKHLILFCKTKLREISDLTIDNVEPK